ncbi:Na+/melibiose symporter-like transporter [Elusimicrobium simillimum]|uniref:hypothetical protein n=1 Tax=Elusimicrobium simillimum TaxID=3143438 RepID=UPI003C6FCBD8
MTILNNEILYIALIISVCAFAALKLISYGRIKEREAQAKYEQKENEKLKTIADKHYNNIKR